MTKAYHQPDAEIPLESVGCVLRLQEVYEKTGLT